MKLTKVEPIRLQIPDFTRVSVVQVGCGGTGSHIASGLVAIWQALAERGITMDVCLVDPDVVEPKNVGRQLFGLADVGCPKAMVIAERLNAAFGTRIGAAVRSVDKLDTFRMDECLNVVIGAVDNARARALINQAHGRDLWWLDCGNDNHSGQVALGNCGANEMKGSVALGMIDRLPAPSVVYLDLVRSKRQTKEKKPSKAPSCAELAAAGEQGLMVNRMAAAWACALLHDFLVTREVRWFALAFDLAWGGTRAYTLDIETLADVTGLTTGELRQPVKGKKQNS